MKITIQHTTYGEIIYEESIWTGKKELTVNGVKAQKTSKKTFIVDGKNAIINGSLYTGMTLVIDIIPIEIVPKPKWYELVLSILPISFWLTWGNHPVLYSNVPVVGGAIIGAICGALGGLAIAISLPAMINSKTVVKKIIVGVAVFVITTLVAYVLEIALIGALAGLQ